MANIDVLEFRDGGFDRFSSRFTIYTFSNKSRNVGTGIFVDSNWI